MFEDLFGVHWEWLKMVQTFGFFVAIAYLTASYILSKELHRKEKQGLMHPFIEKVIRGKKASITELLEAFIVSFIIGYKLVYVALNFTDFTNDTQGFILSLKGNLIGGLVMGAIYTYMRYREKEKQKLPEPIEEDTLVYPHHLVGNITLISAGGGLLGAKLFDALENFGQFIHDPINVLLSFSGLTVYGGLIVGSIAVLSYAKKKKLPLLHLMDAAAPAMLLAYSVGRIGCQMAGDGDWGIPNPAPKPGWMSFLPNWMWSFNFPHNVINEGVQIAGCTGPHCNVLSVPVFPTPFYETVTCAILFFIMWSLRKRITAPGVMFCIYLAMNGVERFLIELIRVNVKYDIFGFKITQAQIISPIFFLVGIYGMYYLTKKAKNAIAT